MSMAERARKNARQRERDTRRTSRKSRLRLKHKGHGRYDIIDPVGMRLNNEPLTKNKAEELIRWSER